MLTILRSSDIQGLSLPVIQSELNACLLNVISVSETESKWRTFLHVLVLLKQIPSCVDVVGKADGGEMFLSAFHLARKL